MARNIDISIGEFYHVYNRGANKAHIFKDDRDRKRFLSLLYLCNSANPVEVRRDVKKIYKDIDQSDKIVAIGCYCLMPNHFHLLLKEIIPNGITRFVHKLSTAYSMYFNKRHNRSGTLYEGNYKAIHVKEDRHLEYLYSYIHLNPVKIIDPGWRSMGLNDLQKTKTYLENYRFSSFPDYFGTDRNEKSIIDYREFPQYFRDNKSFNDFIESWLIFKTDDA